MFRNQSSTLDSSQTNLVQEQEEHFKPLPVHHALYGQLFLVILLLIGIFILPVLYKNEEPNSTDTFSAINYFHLITWTIVTVLTWYIKAEHKKSRIYGYHDFYDSTRHLHRVAFYLMCGGNVLLLVISCLTHNYCEGGGISPCNSELSLTPVGYLQIILVIEIIFILPFLIKHIVEVSRFNRAQLLPDVLRGQLSYQQDQNDVVIGIRGPSYTERLLENQSDVIMTLNKRNEILQQQIYALTQYHINGTPTDA